MQSLFELSDLLSQQVDVELLAVQLLLLALHLPLKLIDERALVGHGVHVHPHQLFGPSCNHSRSRVCSHTLTQVTAFLCERKHTYYIIFAYQITYRLSHQISCPFQDRDNACPTSSDLPTSPAISYTVSK